MNVIYLAVILFIPAIILTGTLIMVPVFIIKEAIDNVTETQKKAQARRHCCAAE